MNQKGLCRDLTTEIIFSIGLSCWPPHRDREAAEHIREAAVQCAFGGSLSTILCSDVLIDLPDRKLKGRRRKRSTKHGRRCDMGDDRESRYDK